MRKPVDFDFSSVSGLCTSQPRRAQPFSPIVARPIADRHNTRQHWVNGQKKPTDKGWDFKLWRPDYTPHQTTIESTRYWRYGKLRSLAYWCEKRARKTPKRLFTLCPERGLGLCYWWQLSIWKVVRK